MNDNRGQHGNANYYRRLIESFESHEEEGKRSEKELTPEELQIKRENDHRPRERELLREHMGLPGILGGPSPLPPENIAGFFIEVAAGRATCKLSTCGRFIEPGHYRMALNPAMSLDNWRRGRLDSVDYYHIRCFEEIADFSQSVFVERVNPITRQTFPLRGLKAATVSSYIVDAGAERLILSWIVTRKRLICRRDGIEPEDGENLAPDFADLLFKAGLPGFAPRKPPGMEISEFLWLQGELAPNESDGPSDEQAWNIFKEYLDETPEGLNDIHDLSDMLSRWRIDRIAATANIETDRWRSDERQAIQQYRVELGPKAVRALKRLSATLMPTAFRDPFIYS